MSKEKLILIARVHYGKFVRICAVICAGMETIIRRNDNRCDDHLKHSKYE